SGNQSNEATENAISDKISGLIPTALSQPMLRTRKWSTTLRDQIGQGLGIENTSGSNENTNTSTNASSNITTLSERSEDVLHQLTRRVSNTKRDVFNLVRDDY
ncbi:hypothetical protein M1146_07365, partial [Patescibacteria group bacterium]|nr:hypothetical protein [Patescibacteria group bacterium]